MPENEYENFRMFSIHTWTDSLQLLNARERLYNELFTRQEIIWERALLIVIADLYKCHLEDPTKYLGFHRANKSYSQQSRYNKAEVGIKPLKKVVDALVSHGYISLKNGFRDRETNIGKVSRIRALPKLIDIIERSTPDSSPVPIPPHKIKHLPSEELIILKKRVGKRKKCLVEYEDTDKTNAMREVLVKYNDLLAKTYIDIDLRGYTSPDEDILRIDTTNKRVRRIFSNNSFDDGGRFYGGWWQNIRSELRERIMMAETDHTTIEKDFKALHINLLYHRVGIDYFATYGDNADPYSLDNMAAITDQEERDRWRNLYKKLLLICINKKRRGKVAETVFKEISAPDNIGQYPNLTIEDIEQARLDFEVLHEPIKHFFYSGIGLELQNVDSMIAERIIKHFTEDLLLPVLCIHDSFIYTNRDSNKADEIITACIEDTLRSLGDDWSENACTIRSITKERNRLAEEQSRRPISDPPFFDMDLREILEEEYTYGSNVYRLENWREHKAQEIITYEPTLVNTQIRSFKTENSFEDDDEIIFPD